MRWNGFEVSPRHSEHLDMRRTGINHSSTAATQRQIRGFWNICRDGNSQRRVAESNEERLKRASRARNRSVAHFRLGDEVDFWRRGKGKSKGARPHIKGRFHGGAVVLATSMEIDEEDGSRKPRKVVWITHAGTVIKCAPEQLRYSSERARQLANMGQAQRLPWTHEGLDGWLRKGQNVDLSMDAPPDGDDRFQKDGR